MNDSPQQIIDILQGGEPIHIKPILERLRNDNDLLKNVRSLAHHAGLQLDALTSLSLEVEAPKMILHYRQSQQLEEGLWILPKLQDPIVDYVTEGRKGLDALAERLSSHPHAGSIAKALGHDWGFSGDKRHYHRPENCFLSHCLENRLGMPITLVSLWILICKRLGYNAWAITLPGHVFGGWDDGYVDCFAAGRAVDTDELHAVARYHGQADASAYLAGSNHQQLLQRFALNLAVSYRQRGDLLRTLIATSMANKTP